MRCFKEGGSGSSKDRLFGLKDVERGKINEHNIMPASMGHAVGTTTNDANNSAIDDSVFAPNGRTCRSSTASESAWTGGGVSHGEAVGPRSPHRPPAAKVLRLGDDYAGTELPVPLSSRLPSRANKKT